MRFKKLIKPIFIGFNYLLLFIIVFICVLLIYISFSDSKSLFGYRTFTVVSNSMKPTYNVNDVIIARENKDLDIGDVIIFRKNTNSSYVAHRIIEMSVVDRDVQIRTQGDNNNTPDPGYINEKHVSGVVISSIPIIGGVITFLQSPNGILFVIIIPSFFLFMYYFFKLSTDMQMLKNKRKKEKKSKIDGYN